MIERDVIDGRPATVAYIDLEFNPVDKDKATFCKIIFDDGDVIFGSITRPEQLGGEASPEREE
ncbi:MAG: hypothetical protein ACYC2K_19065 [Gemmatimonadales bacterium]